MVRDCFRVARQELHHGGRGVEGPGNRPTQTLNKLINRAAFEVYSKNRRIRKAKRIVAKRSKAEGGVNLTEGLCSRAEVLRALQLRANQ